MHIPERYQAELLQAESRSPWLDWSLDYFTDPQATQSPYVDMTLQLDVTEAYVQYQEQTEAKASFFAFLLWHLAQTLATFPDFNLRLVDGQWYRLRNPPIFIPVATGDSERFREMFLENVYQSSYADFVPYYLKALDLARRKLNDRKLAFDYYHLANMVGNLPNLQFTGLTLHWRKVIEGHTAFYFGKRYTQHKRLMIPFAIKMHHACTDPHVLSLLIADFQARFQSATS